MKVSIRKTKHRCESEIRIYIHSYNVTRTIIYLLSLDRETHLKLVMLWGGLRPIRSRFALDVLTLTILLRAVFIPSHHYEESHRHILFVTFSSLVTIFTAGLTQRWTITLPMIPVVIMQLSRYMIQTEWIISTIQWLSVLLVVKASLLSILFPALEISSPKGKYNVGIIDIQLPVNNFDVTHVSARILYPCHESSKMLYLQKDVADNICKQLMLVGAPKSLQGMTWMLDQWKLSSIKATRNGSIIKSSDERGWPLVVYSHGLFGGTFLYSYQTMNLAANGMVVLALNHSDGSSIGFKRNDGRFQAYDPTISRLDREGTFVEYIKERRKQTHYRSNEIIAALDAFLQLNEKNTPELERIGLSFVGLLNTEDITAAGHSFGGASVLTTVARYPQRFTSCVALDPAVDWMPDDERQLLLSKDRFQHSHLQYNGGTGGFSQGGAPLHQNEKSSALHNLDLMFLYSHEWVLKKWGASQFVLDMYKRGKLGCLNGASECAYVFNSKHSEFSDSCMKTPLWLARAIGLTGNRNPHETSDEIASRTLVFIESARRRKEKKIK